MFEGRSALPRTSHQPAVSSTSQASDSANHKQLIDRIRSKDSSELIEKMESGKFRGVLMFSKRFVENVCCSIKKMFRLVEGLGDLMSC